MKAKKIFQLLACWLGLHKYQLEEVCKFRNSQSNRETINEVYKCSKCGKIDIHHSEIEPANNIENKLTQLTRLYVRSMLFLWSFFIIFSFGISFMRHHIEPVWPQYLLSMIMLIILVALIIWVAKRMNSICKNKTPGTTGKNLSPGE